MKGDCLRVLYKVTMKQNKEFDCNLVQNETNELILARCGSRVRTGPTQVLGTVRGD